MVPRRIRVFGSLAVLMISGPALLSGCGTTGPTFVVKDDPWRSPEERACLASGIVRNSPFVHARSALGGPSVCGAEQPFEMSGADGGRVSLVPAASLRCPMIPQIDSWVRDVVKPAARYYFRQELAEVKVMASYSCRPMNSVDGARISEHAYANAIDIGGFRLANGDVVTVKGGWRGSQAEQAFLRQVHNGSCDYFSTVLGPNYNSLHSNHFHLDLARHGRDGTMRICK
ncbi:extensin [Hyphomicrobium methylovorum]|uniref:extensin-like domain-containing protein n=1 Tax=Hyphomicrobium methylovorum TaxID=84 RepID=UPI0015E6AE78|nr:extensin family protein [Hyphomicrobium methylovorum]MBA2126500.1 extensin [Hyphomicrobium methylovorum]